jgi:hypothetical protein
MAISLMCPCGKSYRVKDTLAGRKVRCAGCSEVLEVPAPDSSQDPEQEAADVLLADPPRDQRVTRSERQEYEPPRRQAPETFQKPVRGDSSPSTQVPKKPRRKKAESREGIVFEQGWFGSLNAGLIGGLLMMLIAIVWFVAGLAAGFIFFYPPILLVIGFIAVIRGLLNRE